MERFYTRNHQQEHGAVLVVFAAIILCIVTLLGLAVDAGNLYSAQIGVQASADAAALAGASRIALNAGTEDAEDAARDIALINLQLKRLPFGRDEITFPTQFRIRVALTSNVRLFILGFLPGFGESFRTVSAVAQAEVRPATVSLIVDASESMNCPAETGQTEGSCDCTPDCSEEGSKFALLREAVNEFVQMFDPARDSINLVAIGTGAEVLVPMRPNNFVLQNITEAMEDLTAGGATNVCDAFLRAYMDVNSLPGRRAAETNYVYFSDGAPTAARFLFTSGVAATPNRPIAANWGVFDYLSWGIIMDEGNGKKSIPQRTFFTPPYVDRGNNSYWNPRRLVGAVPKQPPALAPRPGILGVPSTTQPYKPLYEVAPARGMEIFLPDGSITRLGRPENWLGGKAYLWTNWEEGEHMRLYADCALALSDFMRNQGGLFYTIGYGQEAPRTFDPYQNALNPTLRKDFFLTRISTDPCGLVEQHPSFPGVPSLAEIATTATRSGAYYPTADSRELSEVFRRIARTIRMRLVE